MPKQNGLRRRRRGRAGCDSRVLLKVLIKARCSLMKVLRVFTCDLLSGGSRVRLVSMCIHWLMDMATSLNVCQHSGPPSLKVQSPYDPATATCPPPARSWIVSCTTPRPLPLPGGVTDLRTTPPMLAKRTKTKRSNPSPTNLRPQNRRAEWLAFRFCSFYLAAGRLWKTFDFHQKSALLVAGQ